MENAEFVRLLEGFRKQMAEKSLAEIRAFKNVVSRLRDMTPMQLLRLQDDLTLMEHYKTRCHSMNDEFERLMGKSFGYGSFIQDDI